MDNKYKIQELSIKNTVKAKIKNRNLSKQFGWMSQTYIQTQELLEKDKVNRLGKKR